MAQSLENAGGQGSFTGCFLLILLWRQPLQLVVLFLECWQLRQHLLRQQQRESQQQQRDEHLGGRARLIPSTIRQSTRFGAEINI